MVIVGGWFEVDPARRDEFVEQRVESMRRSRADHGCIEYVIAADPLDPVRVVLYERWETQADLDAHGARMAAESTSAGAPSVAPTAMSIMVYDVTGERSLV
jgi:quinol monooxygenase YgiN